MTAVPTPPNGHDLLTGQRHHWETTFGANPEMYGPGPSEPGRHAAKRFAAGGLTRVLELGAGQGRDTLELLRAGLEVTALDYATAALAGIIADAGPELGERLVALAADVRQSLPFPDECFDACYSHMLFSMALTTGELVALAGEVCRVLRPGGLCIYTVRHTGDAHYGTGTDLSDNLYENGGFVVHFFDRHLVDRLAEGFEVGDVSPFEEGSLPRRLWRITMRKPATGWSAAQPTAPGAVSREGRADG